MGKYTLIDRRTIERDYGFTGRQLIVDHPEHGRLLVQDGFGGDGIEGRCVRWRHGGIISLLPDDTFVTLDHVCEITYSTTLAIAEQGYNLKRPYVPHTSH